MSWLVWFLIAMMLFFWFCILINLYSIYFSKQQKFEKNKVSTDENDNKEYKKWQN